MCEFIKAMGSTILVAALLISVLFNSCQADHIARMRMIDYWDVTSGQPFKVKGPGLSGFYICRPVEVK